MKRTRKGFTLVELLIVIAVLGALTSMLTLSSAGAVDAAKAARIIDGMNTIKTAAKMYRAEYGNGTLVIADFKDAWENYFDEETDNLGYDIEEVADDGWYVKYTIPTTDARAAGIKSKLKGHTADGLLKEAKTDSEAYDGEGNDVYMRAFSL